MPANISPLDIRKRTFARRLNGFDRHEVSQFLEMLAEDLAEVSRKLDDLELENNRLRDENHRHRESENTLKETLLMAQRSAEGLRVAVERESERRLKEAEHQADLLMQQGLERVTETERKIRDLRLERRNFHVKLQGMIDMFQQVLNFDREDEELDSSLHILHAKRREGEAG